jgi:hypothetical protein
MRRLVFRMLASCRFFSVLVARSSGAHLAAPVPPASPLVAPSAAHGASIGLHCDHCGRDGHVDAFCYRKKKVHKT